MTHYSVQPRDLIFAKGCRFLSLLEIREKILVKI